VEGGNIKKKKRKESEYVT